jgi:hypothetical protein
MRKILFTLASVVLILCVAAAAFMYWRTAPPFGSFPLSINGMPRMPEILYKKTQDVPGVYLGVYGSETLHSVYPMNSAAEAAESVRKYREYIKEQSARDFKKWKESPENALDATSEDAERYYQQSAGAVYLAPEDSPENDYLVYVSNGRANVDWANGSWFCSLSDTADVYPDSMETVSAAKNLFEMARSFSYAPKNTSPPDDKYAVGFTLYDFVRRTVPSFVKFWLPVILPLAVGFFALVIMLLARPKKTISI